MRENKNILLVDGHNYLFRAYFGVPQSATLKDGTKINAVYGFFAFLRRAVQYTNPGGIIILFDSETGINKRQSEVSEYKGNRTLEDVGMFEQLPIIKSILALIKIEYVEDPLNEADDVIGTISRHLGATGYKVCISSNDWDFCQLVSKNISLLRDSAGELKEYSKSRIISKFGVSPEQYIDYLSLKGDSSDNIKGVPGIGPKRAAVIIREYGGVDVIEKSIESMPENLRKLLLPEIGELKSRRDFLKIRDVNIPTAEISKRAGYSNSFLHEKVNKYLSELGFGV